MEDRPIKKQKTMNRRHTDETYWVMADIDSTSLPKFVPVNEDTSPGRGPIQSPRSPKKMKLTVDTSSTKGVSERPPTPIPISRVNPVKKRVSKLPAVHHTNRSERYKYCYDDLCCLLGIVFCSLVLFMFMAVKCHSSENTSYVPVNPTASTPSVESVKHIQIPDLKRNKPVHVLCKKDPKNIQCKGFYQGRVDPLSLSPN